MSTLKTIHLYDKVAELAGVDTCVFDAKSPLELVNALNSQVPGFRKFANENRLAIVSANDDQSEYEFVKQEDFTLSFGKFEHIHVIPVIEGSGTGAEIVVFGVVFTGAAAVAVSIAINIAISLVVSAVVKALSPSPDTSEGPAGADSRPSFLYNGAKVVFEQGYAIPLIYGTHMSGGICIYTDLVIEDIPYVPAAIPAPTNGWNALFRGEELPTTSYQWGDTGGA